MASKRVGTYSMQLCNGLRTSRSSTQHTFVRSMATEVRQPSTTLVQSYIDAHLDSTPTEPVLRDQVSIPSPASSPLQQAQSQPFRQPPNPFLTTATCTTYSFPAMEPKDLITYPSTHLLLPLRKDLLHRAVIYEGDRTRQGTANTKYRSEVHGSNRKIRPQKGSGMARLGDKKSPMLRGGGVAFGPKPRDFSTELPRKIYDLAWRTALSYRYSRGELLIVDGGLSFDVHEDSRERYMRDVLRHNNMGNAGGRTLFVTEHHMGREALFSALDGRDGKAVVARRKKVEVVRDGKLVEEFDVPLKWFLKWKVDVKDLLELGRVVVERSALEHMFKHHESDLGDRQRIATWRHSMNAGPAAPPALLMPAVP